MRRLPFGFALLAVAFLGTFPAVAPAQLQDAQEAGWSVLKEAYGDVSTMRGDKGARTQGNFEDALRQISSSMANMSPHIDRMGAKVADEDKAYAAGLRDNIKAAQRGVGDAHEALRRAVEAKKQDGKLEEISDEIDRLKTALEQYETACKAAYQNYKAKWDELKNTMDTTDAAFKAAKAKADALEAKDEALAKEEDALQAEWDKAQDEGEKINKMVDDMLILKETIKEKLYKAFDDQNTAEYDRQKEELRKALAATHNIVKLRLALTAKLDAIGDKYYAKNKERQTAAQESEAAMEEMAKLRPLPALVRFSLWDAEFPAKSYAFQALR